MAHYTAHGFFPVVGFSTYTSSVIIPHHITLVVFILTIRGIFGILTLNENWVKIS